MELKRLCGCDPTNVDGLLFPFPKQRKNLPAALDRCRLRLLRSHLEFCSRRRTFKEIAALPDLAGGEGLKRWAKAELGWWMCASTPGH